MLGVDWAESCANALITKILSEWMKICGFSYASAHVEKLKCEKQNSTQTTAICTFHSKEGPIRWAVELNYFLVVLYELK